MSDDVTKQFNVAMMDIYRRARAEAKYNAIRFLQMLNEHGGLETARLLLHATQIPEGYTALWKRGRLDLTVEALIVEHQEYHTLFSAEDVAIARDRLEGYGYEPPP